VKKTEITEEYDLSYIPEGYVLVYELRDEFTIQKRWKDSSEKIITFTQAINGSSRFSFDKELSNTLIEEYDGKVYYCRSSKDTESFLWSENGYTFYVSIPSSIPESEVYRIIDSIIQF
jgi:YHS domain-containing protein